MTAVMNGWIICDFLFSLGLSDSSKFSALRCIIELTYSPYYTCGLLVSGRL